jgi:hypothetical protein
MKTVCFFMKTKETGLGSAKTSRLQFNNSNFEKLEKPSENLKNW